MKILLVVILFILAILVTMFATWRHVMCNIEFGFEDGKILLSVHGLTDVYELKGDWHEIDSLVDRTDDGAGEQ